MMGLTQTFFFNIGQQPWLRKQWYNTIVSVFSVCQTKLSVQTGIQTSSGSIWKLLDCKPYCFEFLIWLCYLITKKKNTRTHFLTFNLNVDNQNIKKDASINFWLKGEMINLFIDNRIQLSFTTIIGLPVRLSSQQVHRWLHSEWQKNFITHHLTWHTK